MTRPQRLTPRHLPQIIALHHAVAEAQSPELMAREDDGFFADHITALGHTYGIFEGRRLIAYAVLGLPTADSPNFGTDHGLSAGDRARVAHIDGIAVAPDRRGRGLHRLLIRHRVAEAEAAGRSILLSTAAPGNLPSLGNLLACGLTARDLIDKFGGTRYLLRHDIGDTARPESGGQWLRVDDLEAQRASLRDGHVGWRLRRDEDGTAMMLHARPVDGNAEDEAAALAARMRRVQAEAIIERHAGYSAVGGLLPVAFLDTLGVVTANLSMVRSLADLYDTEFQADRTRAVVLSVLGGLLPTGLGAAATAALTRVVPGAGIFGMAAASATALALTKALGHSYLTHFETGEPLRVPERPALRRAVMPTGA